VTDRRRAHRATPDAAGWRPEALLRPGLVVRIVNIGPYGALVESQARLRPGRSAELHLVTSGAEQKHVVHGRIERCHVAGLTPLHFRGAIEFSARLQADG
jgi:hypothetical protein